MKIVVTGANGYLGQTVVKILGKNHLQVKEVVRNPTPGKFSCDLLEKRAVLELAQKLVDPDVIINCAACVPKSFEEYQNVNFLSRNTTIIENIILAFDCPIVHISSMTVYGESSQVVRLESDAGNPQSSYGKSKYECEEILKRSGRTSLALRIPGLFGGNRNTGLVLNTLKSILFGDQLKLPENPLLWAAMDVGDAASCIVKLTISQYSGFNPINVGYDETYSINRFVKICEEVCGSKLDYDYDIAHPDFALDLSILKSFNAHPVHDLRCALLNYKNHLLCLKKELKK